MDIKETKELVTFVLKLAKLATNHAPGKVSIDVAVGFMSVMMSSYGALNGISVMSAELLDLSPEEVAELVALVDAEFGLTGKTEAIAEASIEIGISIFNLVKMIKEHS